MPRGSAALGWPELLDLGCAPGGVRSHYQAIVDLARGTVVGHEALARFTAAGPSGGPDVWFAAARRLGRLGELEASALRAAFASRATLPADTFLTVNLGPDVLDHPAVQEVLTDQGSLAGVVVELTEHARVDSYASLDPALDRLRGAGALIAIDDAGSGYAGLQHLLKLRPDIIKLDRGLVEGVDRDEAKRALVAMVGTFASRVDAWVLAEGVETLAELDTVTRLGVPLAQGYLLGRPADGWATLDTGTRSRLRWLQRAEGIDTLRSLLELVPTTHDVVIASELVDQVDVEHVALVDQHGRVVALVRSSGGRLAVHPADLQVNRDTPVGQAAQRALTRDSEHRFRPLLCTDDAGRFVGVVRMERILDHLAATSTDTVA